jgi:phenylacetate-coenzyme A ligase PaaK-like adenylate-forming protein
MTQIDALQAIVAFAYATPHSEWYRQVCTDHGIVECPKIRSIEDFEMLPVLDRATLNRFTPFERLSTDLTHVDDIRSTSGTSGQAPLFYLRTTAYRHMAQQLVQAGARRKIYLWGYQHVVTHVENDRLAGLQTVICDPQQLMHHLPLVKAMKADTLAGTPSLLLLFGQMLDRLEDRLQIRFLELTGEPARAQTLQALKQIFPLAKVFHLYAMGEVGQETGTRGPDCECQDPGYFHLNPAGIYAESKDGELLVTQLNVPTAFPLTRYKTGDRVDWLSPDRCRCGHDGISFELSGRANVDFVRIAGIELRYEEIAAIVAAFGGAFAPYTEVKVREHISDGKQQVSLNVIVVPNDQRQSPAGLQQGLAEALLQKLRLSATTRLSDMVEAGHFARPKITFLPEVPVSTKAPGIRFVET